MFIHFHRSVNTEYLPPKSNRLRLSATVAATFEMPNSLTRARTSCTPCGSFPPRHLDAWGTFAGATQKSRQMAANATNKLSHWRGGGVYRSMLDETQQQSIVTRLNR